MRRGRAALIGLAAAALLALAIAGASDASSGKTRVVKIGDDYYSPVKVTIKTLLDRSPVR